MNIELLEPEAPTSTALTVTARAALALGSDKARTELAAMVKKSAAIVEVKNTAGREECHAAAMVLKKARTNIEAIGKAARDDATKFSKAVIQEEKDLIAITAPEETRLLALRDAWDNARAAEKAEAERIERARVTAIHARIADIKACGLLALECRTSAKVEELIDRLMAQPLDGFEEFEAEAANARGMTLARMKEISDQKLAEEQERARIKAEQQAESARLAQERAQLDRQRAEQAELDRKAAEQRAAAQKAIDDQQAAAREAIAKIDREAAAERAAQQRALDAQAAELRRQREAQEDADRAARLAEQARIDAEAAQAAKIAREQREQAEAQAAAERQRLRDAEEAKAIADKRMRDAAPLMFEALKSIENDDGHIPAAIWKLRCDALAAAAD